MSQAKRTSLKSCVSVFVAYLHIIPFLLSHITFIMLRFFLRLVEDVGAPNFTSRNIVLLIATDNYDNDPEEAR